MGQTFDPEQIEKMLAGLSRRQWVAFAATCRERLLPHYRRFQDVEGWGDADALTAAIDEVWAWVAGANVPMSRFVELEKKCASVMPDTEDFPTLLGSQALDASAAVCEALALCLGADLNHAINAASSARDTVAMFIQERDNLDYADPDFEMKVLCDPLMVGELENQHRVLKDLAQHAELDAEYVTALRSQFSGQSNID